MHRHSGESRNPFHSHGAFGAALNHPPDLARAHLLDLAVRRLPVLEDEAEPGAQARELQLRHMQALAILRVGLLAPHGEDVGIERIERLVQKRIVEKPAGLFAPALLVFKG